MSRTGQANCRLIKDSGWQLCRDIYGALGERSPWTWIEITSNRDLFENWYGRASQIMANDSIVRKFSNHRKYESLRPNASRNVPRVIKSYLSWIGNHNSHEAKLAETINDVGVGPSDIFNELYKSMKTVISFGRTGKFDYLTMVGKLGLTHIYPPLTYMNGATGPVSGANLLFYGVKTSSVSTHSLESKLATLNSSLPLGDFGMQVLEDSLCNWQKSPTNYVYFRG